MKNDLYVTVRDRSGLLFQGNALSITSANNKGKFDILPQHANFISLIQDKLDIRKRDKTHEILPVASGIMLVASNVVDIYLGIKK